MDILESCVSSARLISSSVDRTAETQAMRACKKYLNLVRFEENRISNALQFSPKTSLLIELPYVGINTSHFV